MDLEYFYDLQTSPKRMPLLVKLAESGYAFSMHELFYIGILNEQIPAILADTMTRYGNFLSIEDLNQFSNG